MSLSGPEPEPERFAVQCWYEYQRQEPMGPTLRTHMSVQRFHTEAAAAEHVRAARRGRWVPEHAWAWGVEPVGFKLDPPGERISAAEYVRRHRADGTGDDVAVSAVARSLTLFRELPGGD